MSSFQQTLTEPVAEKSTTRLQLQLTDENDVALTDTAVSTVTLTLYDQRSGSIINSRSGSDIKNANGGTLSAGALLTLILGDADNAIVNGARASETHVALLSWTWAGGTKTGRKELAFTVYNQPKVT